jgi:hypothetical protein
LIKFSTNKMFPIQLVQKGSGKAFQEVFTPI